ncbi:amidohydrolase family protein [Sphingobium sp. CFD-2]|uniref:amidohydrolase family protein n=1 Tax=Sphingobium sp. CFD-2 TaxID=2878542 RepID=UPI00214BA8BF|nr:amidohydrolase [Sphingobium sp. CFD-2]
MTITLDEIRGNVLDLDSHEMVPTTRYEQVFGARAGKLLKEFKAFWDDAAERYKDDPNNLAVEVEDVMAVTQGVVWETKGPSAPGAIDMDRRPDVMDVMGIRRQLIFPGFGLFAFCEAHGGGYAAMPKATPEQMQMAQDAVDDYNEWAGHHTSRYPDRLRIVGILASGVPGLTPEGLVARTEKLIRKGVRSVLMSSGLPPAGLSPADPLLDPFYQLLADSNVSLVVHPPSAAGFRPGEVWGRARLPGNFPVHLGLQRAEENLLGVMIMGGVFERHPNLRFGAIESGGFWIGPLADRLDAALDSMQALNPRPIPDFKTDLSLKPSEYIARNVRVGVLLNEPVEEWIVRYPHLQDVYCYSSDYPHGEGQAHSMQKFYDRVAPLGDEVLKKFFMKNGELLLPAA